MSLEQNPFFLKKKYGDLHTATEVTQAARRKEARTGEKVPQDPATRIQNYLDRFKEITDRKNPEERERGIEAIKRLLYRTAIIKAEDIPESYWDGQRRMAREQGHGDIDSASVSSFDHQFTFKMGGDVRARFGCHRQRLAQVPLPVHPDPWVEA